MKGRNIYRKYVIVSILLLLAYGISLSLLLPELFENRRDLKLLECADIQKEQLEGRVTEITRQLLDLDRDFGFMHSPSMAQHHIINVTVAALDSSSCRIKGVGSPKVESIDSSVSFEQDLTLTGKYECLMQGIFYLEEQLKGVRIISLTLMRDRSATTDQNMIAQILFRAICATNDSR